jgi:hypothetical protein
MIFGFAGYVAYYEFTRVAYSSEMDSHSFGLFSVMKKETIM